MKRLKVTIKTDTNAPGNHSYSNEVNGDDFKAVAIILEDLANHNIPIDKASKEYSKNRKNAWDSALGI